MKLLDEVIQGRGEVKGKTLTRLFNSKEAYLYECTGESFSTHYEVFRRRENKQFNCESYPTSKSFGKWAWTYNNIDQAKNKFKELSEDR